MSTDQSTPTRIPSFTVMSEEGWEHLSRTPSPQRVAADSAVRHTKPSQGRERVIIYALTEPGEPWNIRYIGKVVKHPLRTIDGTIRSRLSQHMYDARSKNLPPSHRLNWLRKLMRVGLTPGYFLVDEATHATMAEVECAYIALCREAGFKLVNTTDGGEGVVGLKHRPESIARRRRGRRWPQAPSREHRQVQGELASAEGQRLRFAAQGQVQSHTALEQRQERCVLITNPGDLVRATQGPAQ
jgi:hypothetical protein